MLYFNNNNNIKREYLRMCFQLISGKRLVELVHKQSNKKGLFKNVLSINLRQQIGGTCS